MEILDEAHFWVAKIDEVQLEEIFRETYSEGQRPISEFAESQDEMFYDHDFFYIESLTEGIDSFFENAGIPKDNHQSISKVFSNYQSVVSHVIVADIGDFSAPRSCYIRGVKFDYLGVFKHGWT